MAISPHAIEKGSIAIGPIADSFFAEAIARGGGLVAPLSDSSRGLVWLANNSAKELASILAQHPGLSWIQLPWAGVDSYADIIMNFSREGRVFTSAKGAYSEPVAEHALALALAVMRSLPHRARLDSWEGEIRGTSLHRKRVCILGGGGIARELIRILSPFDTEITLVRRSGTAVSNDYRTVTSAALDDVLLSTDVLIVAAALTPETRGMIGREQLERMPAGSWIVNVARGPIIDTDALVDALYSGHLSGAGLDVTDPEPLPPGHRLWTAPNIIITPHQADTPEMTRPLLAERIVANVSAFMHGGSFFGIVDPELGY